MKLIDLISEILVTITFPPKTPPSQQHQTIAYDPAWLKNQANLNEYKQRRATRKG